MSSKYTRSPARISITIALLATTASCSAPNAPTSNPASSLFDNLTPAQTRILADGRVTRAEYQSAIQDSIQCLRSMGLEVSGPNFQPNGLLTYSYESSNQSSEPPTGAPPGDTCQKLSATVEAVYILQHSGTVEDAKRSLIESIRCLNNAGLSLPLDATPGVVNEQSRDAVAQGRITREVQDGCLAAFKSASLQPLPGLNEAWAAYQQAHS